MSYEKKFNLLSFMIGSGIGILFTFTVFGQQESYTIAKPSNQSISTDRGVESAEEGVKQPNELIKQPVKLIEVKRGGDSETDRQVKETSSGGIQLVLVKGFPEDSLATKIATYAYKISGGDLDFLATLKAENGGFDMHLQSRVIDKYGKREESYGLCQMMRKRHKEVNTEEFWNSWEYQVEICYKKYKGGTRFYGYDVRHKYLSHFTIIGNQ